MSRIGKLPVNIPGGVKISVSADNMITVEGPKGKLQQQVNPDIKIDVADELITLSRPTDERQHRSMHGLYRSLIANMVKGVSEGFTITQELIGVGYKAQATGQLLELTLGYSHYIVLEMPPEIKVTTVTERGKNPTIIMTSCDKQLIGQVAAKIRSFRKPEPYKGKGIRFLGEEVRRKAGKAAAEK